MKYNNNIFLIIVSINKSCRGKLIEAMVNKGDTREPKPKTSIYSCRVPVFEIPQNSIVLFATVEGKNYAKYFLRN